MLFRKMNRHKMDNNMKEGMTQRLRGGRHKSRWLHGGMHMLRSGCCEQ